jgi:hypothetical protein
MGSDHEVFEEASFGVPMAYFHDWPDVTIHTNKDLPENLDETKLGRVAYLGAGIAWTLAALPDGEAGRLLVEARAAADQSVRAADLRAERMADAPDASVVRHEARAVARELLASVGRLWPSTAAAVGEAQRRLAPAGPPVVPTVLASRDSRVPVRSPEVRGPLGVYYYDHLEEVFGGDAPATALARRPEGELLAYECLNLVDGRRSVSDIRDVLTGRYTSVPAAEIGEYLELLARAKVVTWR